MRHAPGPRPPVLAFGGGITLLGVLRSLWQAGIPVLVGTTVSDAYLKRSRWFRRLRPAISSHIAPMELARRLAVVPLDEAVLMPCSDHWTAAVAALPRALRLRFPACVAPSSVLSLLIDKGLFAGALAAASVPHPLTIEVRSIDDITSLPDTQFERGFLKPRLSHLFFSRYGVKAFRCRSKAEAVARYDEVHHEGHDLLLQDYVPGPPTAHVFLDGFVDRHGRLTALFARRRLRMFPPDFGNSTAMVSIPLSEVRQAEDAVRRLLASIAYRGIFSAEFKRDARDGVYKILEVNARPWWYVRFAATCGVDVCAMAYHDALGEDVRPVTRYHVGRTCVYPQQDWFACRRLRAEGGLSLREWASLWLTSRQPVFEWRDPLPALWDWVPFVADAVKALGRGSSGRPRAPTAGRA